MAGVVVELSDVVVRFGRVRVLDGVSLVMGEGDVVALRGSNGSGKTTLLRTLAGVLAPSDGRRVGPKRCAYVPALVEAPALNAGAWLLGVPRSGRENPTPVLGALGFTGDLSRPCRALSFGNLRKLMIAEAFSSNPALVVIDEASAGLDAHGIDGLTMLVARCRTQGGTVVLADQDDRPTLGADQVLTVQAGALVSGVEDSTAASQGCVDITLTGPANRLGPLLEQAHRIGFERAVSDI